MKVSQVWSSRESFIKKERTTPLTDAHSHPTIGAVGLTEPQAREKYGDDVKIYKSKVSVPLVDNQAD